MTRKFMLVPVFLIVAALSLGLILPTILLENLGEEIDYVTPTPTLTRTPGSALVSSHDLSTPMPDLSSTPIRDCTYNRYYWQGQFERWPAQVVVGGRPYTREEMKILFEIETEDVPTLVIRESYVAFLNILNGAHPAAIEKTVVEASSWVRENQPGVLLSQLNQEIGRGYLLVLQEYNEGWLGPLMCPDNPPTPTPVPTVLGGPAANSAVETANAATDTPAPVPTATQRIYIPAPTLRPTDPPPPPPPPQPPPATVTPPPTATQPPPPTDPPPPTEPPPPPPTEPPPPPPPTEPPTAEPTPTVPPEG